MANADVFVTFWPYLCNGCVYTAFMVGNKTDSLKKTKTTSYQTFKCELAIENYFDVPNVLKVKNHV